MRIIKRKKGHGEFYYIQHSYKEEGKVITKEKYLGKKIPNEETLQGIKEELLQEKKDALNNKLEKIRADFQMEWRRIPASAKENELREIAIAFTYNTNAIEGSTITLEETREILEKQIAPNKPLRDIKETEAHAKVFLDALKKKGKITKELMLKWHESIFVQSKPDIAGKFRDYLIRVGDYVAPDWQDVEGLMKDFFNYVNMTKKMNCVEFAARIHYRFEKIHPFGDGNGRIGSILMNHNLWHDGYPMMIICYKKRKSYYRALKRTEDYFVKYFIRYYLSVHKKRYTKKIKK